MKADIYTIAGKKKGSAELPETVFGLTWNKGLMHQVVTAMQANARPTVAHVKDRGEVRGGGRKPWQQKGTGRARHGSIRSPIWVGGGVTHGPRNEKDYSQKINKKMRTKALAIALSQKVRDAEMMLVDDLALASPKTKEAKAALSALSKIDGFSVLSGRAKNAVLLIVPEAQPAILKSFRNIGNVSVYSAQNLNPVEVLRHKRIVLVGPDISIPALEKRITAK